MRLVVQDANIIIDLIECGIFEVFDQLLQYSLLSQADAMVKLQHLQAINPRLPNKEIEKRLKAWSS